MSCLQCSIFIHMYCCSAYWEWSFSKMPVKPFLSDFTTEPVNKGTQHCMKSVKWNSHLIYSEWRVGCRVGRPGMKTSSLRGVNICQGKPLFNITVSHYTPDLGTGKDLAEPLSRAVTSGFAPGASSTKCAPFFHLLSGFFVLRTSKFQCHRASPCCFPLCAPDTPWERQPGVEEATA